MRGHTHRLVLLFLAGRLVPLSVNVTSRLGGSRRSGRTLLLLERTPLRRPLATPPTPPTSRPPTLRLANPLSRPLRMGGPLLALLLQIPRRLPLSLQLLLQVGRLAGGLDIVLIPTACPLFAAWHRPPRFVCPLMAPPAPPTPPTPRPPLPRRLLDLRRLFLKGHFLTDLDFLLL